MPWFAQGIAAADGRLYLGRRWLAPWKRVLKLDWEIDRSEAVIEAISAMHHRLAEATSGRAWTSPTWTLLRNLVTPHPLGGCAHEAVCPRTSRSSQAARTETARPAPQLLLKLR